LDIHVKEKNHTKTPKELMEIRGGIDEVDEELISLLKRRIELAVKAGGIKRERGLDVFDPVREEALLRRIRDRWGEDLPADYILPIYREIIGASRAVQRSPRVAYLGPVASFTYAAAQRRFGRHGDFFSSVSITDVFDAVSRGEADFGVVPVENSTEGIVSHTLDMFIESELKIIGEIFLKISFDLMSKTGKEENIKKVISHPHALAQTRRWILHNLPRAELIEAKSTSEAALMASKDASLAAVAGEEAGKLYELSAVKRDIGDKVDNYTRFLVIAEKSPGPTGNDKTSILFSVKDRPGILHRVLGPFSRARINLTKIESRPSRRELWDYVFFLDMLGHIEDKKVRRAVERIQRFTTTIRLLGSYPREETRSRS
jgi:chorismate mutase/prephenate dehydratase